MTNIRLSLEKGLETWLQMPSFTEIKFSLELDDKTKKMAFPPASFDKWFELA